MAQHHFSAHKHQNGNKAIFEHTKLLYHIGQEKIHGTQSEDGQNIRTEYEKWIGGDGQNSRDTVQSK